MHKIKELELHEQYPEAYGYFKYLMKRHKIEKKRLRDRQLEVQHRIEPMLKIPQKEYREIEIKIKNHSPYPKSWTK
jgi:hypothetical protein